MNTSVLLDLVSIFGINMWFNLFTTDVQKTQFLVEFELSMTNPSISIKMLDFTHEMLYTDQPMNTLIQIVPVKRKISFLASSSPIQNLFPEKKICTNNRSYSIFYNGTSVAFTIDYYVLSALHIQKFC